MGEVEQVRLEVALKLIQVAGSKQEAMNITRIAEPIVKYIMTGVVN